jgi:hypothetical protein
LARRYPRNPQIKTLADGSVALEGIGQAWTYLKRLCSFGLLERRSLGKGNATSPNQRRRSPAPSLVTLRPALTDIRITIHLLAPQNGIVDAYPSNKCPEFSLAYTAAENSATGFKVLRVLRVSKRLKLNISFSFFEV